MPEGIIVDYATIHAASEDCNKTGGELETAFEDLKARLAPLTSSWTGDAQAMWQERQDAYYKALEELKAVLARIATALPQIADGYQSTDKGVSSLF